MIPTGLLFVLASLLSWQSASSELLFPKLRTRSLQSSTSSVSISIGSPSQGNSGQREDPSSPSALAFEWQKNDTNATLYSEDRRQQRYALAVFYFATDGEAWANNTDWLSHEVDECVWYNQGLMVCDTNGTIIDLSLQENNLTGTLPTEISMLSKLQTLELSGNMLSGTIPSVVGELKGLMQLFLNRNNFTGSIPMEITNLEDLSTLDLGENNLTGTIPEDILFALPDLEVLALGGNSITGSLPVVPYNKTMDSNNTLMSDDVISAISKTLMNYLNESFSNMSNSRLTFFNASTNILTGGLSSDFALLPALEGLALDNNALNGTLPPQLGNSPSLLYINLSNNSFSGSIPFEWDQLNNLTVLAASNNYLEGGILPEIIALPQLVTLDLEDNPLLAGSIPSQLGLSSTLSFLVLNRCNITSSIPTEIGQASFLQDILLSTNSLTGALPSELGLLTAGLELQSPMGLQRLWVDGNPGLTGTLPEEFRFLVSLQDFRFNNTQLKGDFVESFRPGLNGGNTSAVLSQQPSTTGSQTPNKRPTRAPTKRPTRAPTKRPTRAPTKRPTRPPTTPPTRPPTTKPTASPTTVNPTASPGVPTAAPTAATTSPTKATTVSPTATPSDPPTPSPTKTPTAKPTNNPTATPTANPTANPTPLPTKSPTKSPTPDPTMKPTPEPTKNPTPDPTRNPTPDPTMKPTPEPTKKPTPDPTRNPTPDPTKTPTRSPTELQTTGVPVDIKLTLEFDQTPGGEQQNENTILSSIKADCDNVDLGYTQSIPPASISQQDFTVDGTQNTVTMVARCVVVFPDPPPTSAEVGGNIASKSPAIVGPLFSGFYPTDGLTSASYNVV